MTLPPDDTTPEYAAIPQPRYGESVPLGDYPPAPTPPVARKRRWLVPTIVSGSIFLLLIVGRSPFPLGLWASFHPVRGARFDARGMCLVPDEADQVR